MNYIKDKNAYLKELFLDTENKAPMYGIYQLKQNSDYHFHRFTSFDTLIETGNSVERENYDFIYADRLTEGDNLDKIYERFNINHPADFKGHSLSISDIIVLKENGIFKTHYVDRYGFKEIPDFFSPKPITYDKEPTVTIGYTEGDYLYEGQQLPLSEANKLFEALDSNKFAEKKGLYDKTDFRIDFVQDGKPNYYEGRFDIGDGEGTLVSHIRARAEHYLSSKGQELLQRLGAKEAEERTAEYQYILDSFVPYMILHNEIADLDKHIDIKLSEIFTTEEDRTKRAYYESLKEYVYSSRRNLNTRTGIPLPEFPSSQTINLTEQERETLNGYKHHIARLPRPLYDEGNQKPVKNKSDMEM